MRIDEGNHWPTTIASLAVGTVFLSLWFWLLPAWLDFRIASPGMARWRWLGVVPCVFGFLVAVRCIWDFGWTGRGTPAPFIPPRRLVVVGMYGYVRNPMYLGFFLGWFGLWMLFGKANLISLWFLLLLIAIVALFVKYYEEPTLRATFGPDYEEYCRNVPRWAPRVRAWTM
jgi:protein-S-isoprenylcysteine O-methyltransferase Ste14